MDTAFVSWVGAHFRAALRGSTPLYGSFRNATERAIDKHKVTCTTLATPPTPTQALRDPHLRVPNLLVAGTLLNFPSLILSPLPNYSLCAQSYLFNYSPSLFILARCQDPPLSATMASSDVKELGVEMQAIDTEQGIDNSNVVGTHISAKSIGTAEDQRDMRIMGKLQELRVSNLFYWDAQPLTGSAKLPLYLYFRLYLYTDEYVGD